MYAGGMKYHIQILKPETEENDFGESQVRYKACCTVWAQRVKLSGNRSEEVQEHFPDYRAEFNIRLGHVVKANWRVKQLGGDLYTVTNVIPNLDKGYTTLICDKVNE